MSTHIAAREGQIAETVLLPGDPLRAKYIAENFLEDAECYNEIRGMYGYTGRYKGQHISVQGTGMGIPSCMIYATELLKFYGVKTMIRVGTAGAITPDVRMREVVLASSASTTSKINDTRFMGYAFAPTADFSLLKSAYDAAQARKVLVRVGAALSSDQFYGHDEGLYSVYAKYGVLCVEMEAAGLYTLAPLYGARALAILTISDNMVTGEETTAEEREKSFSDMIHIALETSIAAG